MGQLLEELLSEGQQRIGRAEEPMADDPSIEQALLPTKDADINAEFDRIDRRVSTPINLRASKTGLVEDLITTAQGRYTPPSGFSVIDYISDATQETLVGVVEGATLQNIDFGRVGPDTSIGGYARMLGKIGGSIIPYAGISAIVGALGVPGAIASVPFIIAKGGITAFAGRALTNIVGTGGDDEGVLDRVENSLQAAGVGMALAALPLIWDAANLKFQGGAERYANKLKNKMVDVLSKQGITKELTDEAVSGFETAVVENGGFDGLRASALKRIAKNQKAVANKWLPLNKSIHGIAGKKGLGLSKEDYYKTNIQVIGEAHTDKMSVEDLTRLRTYYVNELKRFRGTNKFMPENGGTYEKTQALYSNFEPGFFSQHRPVERVMRQTGFQNLYDEIYDGEIKHLNFIEGYDTVRKAFAKGIPRSERFQILKLMDTTAIAQDTTDDVVYSTYQKAAAGGGISARGLEASVWMRRTFSDMLKKQNIILAAEGKEIITPRDAYVTHLIEDSAKSMGGVTPEIWSVIKKGSTGFNGFLKERLGVSGIIEDPFKAHAAYTRAASKMINLHPVVGHVKDAIANATELVDGVKVPKVLPTSVRQYIDDWLQHGVLGVSKNIDRSFNSTLRMSARSAVSSLKMATYRGTLLFNPTSVVKNLTQQELNIARLGKYWFDGIKSLNPKREFMDGLNGWQFASEHSKLLQSRMPGFEGIDPTTLGYLTKIGMTPFNAVDKANVITGFNGGVKKYLADGKSLGESIKLADRLVRDTQFSYLNIDQPLAWLSAPGKLASQFQTWWTRYLEEMWSWGGKMPIGDGSGRMINIAKHTFNVAKSKEMQRYIGINLMLLGALKAVGLSTGLVQSTLPIPGVAAGPLPSGLPPALDGLLTMGGAIYNKFIGNHREAAKDYSKLKKITPMFVVPGYATLVKTKGIIEGRRPLSTLFLPSTREEYTQWNKAWKEGR